ncbi:MAG: choice-of-anchor I family protein [Cytophagaceae bacterium]|nr:choice-of-anchor I family protein [Cytophagaceae bacterium]MDW8456975.1 choice-of-anchor I family protein [Cytophagaceae bacterium]
MKKIYTLLLLNLSISAGIFAQPKLNSVYKGRYISGYVNNEGGVMEISAYDEGTKKLFTINGNTNKIEVLNLSDPSNPVLITTLDMSAYGGGANSIAVKNGILAAAVEATPKQNNGSVVFFNASTLAHLKTVTVGALPDMLTFTPDGKKVVVANEGEPTPNYSTDPEGSISVIDISSGVANATVTNINFNSFDSQKAALQAAGVRIFGGATVGAHSVSQDLEPEYITVSEDSKTAWVVCQENNAMVIVNLQNNTILAIKPLGYKDHSIAGNGIDASDRNGGNPSTVINITTWPVKGMYMPDGIANMRYNNATYILTANEGDSRDWTTPNEEVRINSVDLDDTNFPNETTLKNNANLGRLKISNVMGNTDASPDFEELYCYGARSFSVWDSSMTLVYDSGDKFEQFFKNNHPTYIFNANHNENNNMSSRSDDKGPEPEAIVTAHIGDSVYAFIGLERISGVMVYNVTNPIHPTFVQYLSTRNFSQSPVNAAAGPGATPSGGDLGPEGLLFIPAQQGPNNKPHLVVSYEVSGTITVYELNAPLAAEPGTISSNLTFSNVTTNSMTISWTKGSGQRNLVVMRAGAPVSVNPEDGADYAANAVFETGANMGNNNYVVYNGTGNSVNVTGLNPNTTYFVEIFEYNGKWGNNNYRTSASLTGSRTTLNNSSTSIVEQHIEAPDYFYAYPNPNQQGALYLNTKSNIEVYNSLGQLVSKANNVMQLDITDWEKGIYMIRNSFGQTYKFVKE